MSILLKIKHLLIFIMLMINISLIEAKNDTLQIKYNKDFYDNIKNILENQKTNNTFLLDTFKASLPALIAFIATILTISFTYKQTKKQLYHTEYILLNKQKSEQIWLLINLLAEYISYFELSNSDTINKIVNGISISQQQSITENKLKIILDINVKEENDLLKVINSYRNNKIENVYNWLETLILTSQKLVEYKSKNNEIKF